MSLVDELAKLDELRRSGALSDAEFTKAKAALLSGRPQSPTRASESTSPINSPRSSTRTSWPKLTASGRSNAGNS